MVKCPNCGEENHNSQRFCSKCRTELKLSKKYSEIGDIKNQLEVLKEENNNLKEENKKLLGVYSSKNQEYDFWEDENKKLSLNYDSIEKNCENLEKSIFSYEKRIDDLKKKKWELRFKNPFFYIILFIILVVVVFIIVCIIILFVFLFFIGGLI